MLFYQKFLIIVAIINSFDDFIGKIKWNNKPNQIYISFVNMCIFALIQLLIIYKYPILFVSWLIVSDPYIKQYFANRR